MGVLALVDILRWSTGGVSYGVLLASRELEVSMKQMYFVAGVLIQLVIEWLFDKGVKKSVMVLVLKSALSHT
jgi:hypothetical protein